MKSWNSPAVRQSRNSTRQKERQTNDLIIAVQTDTDWNYSLRNLYISHFHFLCSFVHTQTSTPLLGKVYEWERMSVRERQASFRWVEKDTSDDLLVWSFTHIARHSGCMQAYCRWMEFHCKNRPTSPTELLSFMTCENAYNFRLALFTDAILHIKNMYLMMLLH